MKLCSIEGCDKKHEARGYCRVHYRKTTEQRKTRILEKRRYRLRQSREARIFKEAKKRARKRKIEFNLEKSDILIPKYCPYLGIRIKGGINGSIDSSPSLDRIDPTKGYIKGNIEVISMRANSIKSYGTAEEHEKIAARMRQLLSKESLEGGSKEIDGNGKENS